MWLNQHLLYNLSAPDVILPERYQDADVFQIGNETFQKAAKKYLANFYELADKGTGMLLLGRSRTWKTYTAAAVARRVNKIPLDVTFVQCAIDILDMARNQFSEETRKKLESYHNASLLIMDDFAEVPANTPGHLMLLGIAEARFGKQKPTIWTGNVGSKREDVMSELSQTYGAGFARRVYDGSEGFRVLAG